MITLMWGAWPVIMTSYHDMKNQVWFIWFRIFRWFQRYPWRQNVIFTPKTVHLATPQNPQPLFIIHETFPKSGVKMSWFRRAKSWKSASELSPTYYDIRMSWFVRDVMISWGTNVTKYWNWVHYFSWNCDMSRKVSQSCQSTCKQKCHKAYGEKQET